eukprot:gene28169-34985_t
MPSLGPTATKIPTFEPTPAVGSPTDAPVFVPTAAPSVSLLGTCQKTPILISNYSTICSAYKSIKTSFDSVTSTRSTVSSVYGAAIRLAFHDAGEFNISTSDLNGPDGCLSQNSENAGLIESDSLVITLIEQIYLQYCNLMSRADFWVLFAKLAVEKSSDFNVTIPYHFGRTDQAECNSGEGRLPNAGLGQDEFHRVFVKQMGLTLADAVTLIGAHTVGHTHPEFSGFGQLNAHSSNPDLINSWDLTPSTFDNNYYGSLAGRSWKSQRSPNTTNVQNEWHFGGFASIMLNADMSCAFEPNVTNAVGSAGQNCGPIVVGGSPGCLLPRADTLPVTYTQVQSYIANNTLFLEEFAASFVKMVTVGHVKTDHRQLQHPLRRPVPP